MKSATDHGFHKLTDEDYFALPYISKSGLDLIARSPFAYRYWQDNPRPTTKSMDLGTATHHALLDPDWFAANYGVLTDIDRRTKEGKATWAQWQAENVGKRPLSVVDYAAVTSMLQAVRGHEQAGKLLQGGKAEMTAIWPWRDITCRSKIDYLGIDYVIDLKTTSDASFDEFRKSVVDYRYHVQAAFYLDAVNAIAERPAARFYFVVVESKPPHHVAVYEADANMLAIGRKLYERDLRRYAACAAAGEWPGLPVLIQPMGLPEWYLQKHRGLVS